MLKMDPALITSSETSFLFRGQGTIKKLSESRGFEEFDYATRFIATSYTSSCAELYRKGGEVFAIQVTKDRPLFGIPVPNHLKDLGIPREIARDRGLIYHDESSNLGNFRTANNEIILTPNQGFSISKRAININGKLYRPVIVGTGEVHRSQWLHVENSLRAKLS